MYFEHHACERSTSPHPQSKISVQAAATALTPRLLGTLGRGWQGALCRACSWEETVASLPVLHICCWATLSLRVIEKMAPSHPYWFTFPDSQAKSHHQLEKAVPQRETCCSRRLTSPQHWWRVKSTVENHKARAAAQVSNLWAAVNRHTCRTHKEWDLRLVHLVFTDRYRRHMKGLAHSDKKLSQLYKIWTQNTEKLFKCTWSEGFLFSFAVPAILLTSATEVFSSLIHFVINVTLYCQRPFAYYIFHYMVCRGKFISSLLQLQLSNEAAHT